MNYHFQETLVLVTQITWTADSQFLANKVT